MPGSRDDRLSREPHVLGEALVIRPELRRNAGFANPRETSGQDCGPLFPVYGKSTEYHRSRLHTTPGHGRHQARGDFPLHHEVPRTLHDHGHPLLARGRAQAVPFHRKKTVFPESGEQYESAEISQHPVANRLLPQPPALHERKKEFLPEPFPADQREKRLQGRGSREARSRCVHQRHVPRAPCLYHTRHSAAARCPELQRIDAVVLQPADHRVHSPQTAQRFQEKPSLPHR